MVVTPLRCPRVAESEPSSRAPLLLDAPSDAPSSTACATASSRPAERSFATGLLARLVTVATFKTSDAYLPTGDQPSAIADLSEGLVAGERYQTLLGATGTGKTATMA